MKKDTAKANAPGGGAFLTVQDGGSQCLNIYEGTAAGYLRMAPEVGPRPPYRYLGGSLGLCDDFPIVRFATLDGGRLEGDAAEVLRQLDLFAEPDQSRILFDVAVQYGLNPWETVDRNRLVPQNAHPGQEQGNG